MVRTLHNVRPHNAVTRRQERFLLKLDAVTDTFVHLNGCSPTSPGAIHARIPHGDYREQFGSTEPADYRPGRFLVIGRIEPYKGVDRFLATFARSGIAGEECRVVGSAPEGLRTTLESQISSWSRADVNVSARFEFVSDAEMADEITSAQVIVLPYEEMLNSGIALVALSLGRPILVPRNCANTELAHEAGPEWVIQYDGAFGEDALKAARSASPQSPDSRPNLDGRDWRSVAERYAEVFRSARHVRKSSNV
ncbi:glycosyltransferase [Microbacterium radiodurans]|uniref:Glycosyltransferase n=1 Tax=Microbacterium radiodurans TaxID=661398 RepID=A0A5J5IR78_9MICO|nr:glycosyltransferase [Microbacterium radiodurans]KAA9084151.1 hypothetical protein F6B42_14325 [Microbacterium radiodurans]